MARAAPSWHEVSVAVGWGSLRGKTCLLGEPKGGAPLRLLALHGWLDNANSFDALVPLLPAGLEVLALDLAGHGLSDHLPAGARYDAMTQLVHLREATQRLGWTDFVLLAHSLGALVSNYYAALYPQAVRALVVLDYLVPFHAEGRLATWRAENRLMRRQERGRGRARRVYSEAEALARLVKARKGGDGKQLPNVDEAAARILLPRSARRVDGGLVWRHDEKARTRYSMLHGSDNWMHVVSHVTCPVLVVRADDGLCQQPDDLYEPVLAAYRRSARVFRYERVAGAHHVHLTHPERVAPSVTHFLTHDAVAAQGKAASKL
ncbi:serine hydrolase-like protein [Penaeus vannamei]|uniref:serine hydrolase-like protein n=1 Tax=Penaeus vannamei TaxID=6689 RepID=UPI00387F923E